jgi:hypothetical protein
MMTFNRKILFAGLKAALNPTGFDEPQVTAIAAIVSEFERRALPDVRWLAYILATVWHEARFKSVREIGRGKGKKYGVPHKLTGKIYYGRGFSQITWYDNYLKFRSTLNLPLTTDPDMALLVPVAVAILFEGMTTGVTAKDSFTKYQLHDFFNATKDDPVMARSIINGRKKGEPLPDKAKLIAGYHDKILAVLQKAKRDGAPAAKPAAMKPVVAHAEQLEDEVITVPASPSIDGSAAAGAAVVAGSGIAAASGFPWERVLLLGGCALALIAIIVVVLNFRSKSHEPK